jgi:hypothetical protein
VFTLLPSAASGCNDENATYEARRLSIVCACACAAAVAESFAGAAGPAVRCGIAAEPAFEVLLPPLGVADRPPDEAVAATVAPEAVEVALFVFVEAVAAAGVGVVAFFTAGLAEAAAGGFVAEARISGWQLFFV